MSKVWIFKKLFFILNVDFKSSQFYQLQNDYYEKCHIMQLFAFQIFLLFCNSYTVFTIVSNCNHFALKKNIFTSYEGEKIYFLSVAYLTIRGSSSLLAVPSQLVRKIGSIFDI